MKRLSLLIALVGSIVLAVSCHPHTHTTQATYATECQYLNHESDGSITIRAYGQGRNRGDALEQARKNAVEQVIFKGIYVPGNSSLSRPLVYEVNAREKYEDFFNTFFRDGGDFNSFVHGDDKRIGTNEKSWSGTQAKISTTVTVERGLLKQYLKDINIIKE